MFIPAIVETANKFKTSTIKLMRLFLLAVFWTSERQRHGCSLAFERKRLSLMKRK